MAPHRCTTPGTADNNLRSAAPGPEFMLRQLAGKVLELAGFDESIHRRCCAGLTLAEPAMADVDEDGVVSEPVAYGSTTASAFMA